MYTKAILIKITEQMQKDLKAHAFVEGCSKSAYIRNAIDAKFATGKDLTKVRKAIACFMANNEDDRPRGAMIFALKELGLLDENGILKK